MGHQVIKLQNPLKTLGFLQFYRFKTVKDRIITLLSILSSKAPPGTRKSIFHKQKK